MNEYIKRQKKIAKKLESSYYCLTFFVVGWASSGLVEDAVVGGVAMALALFVLIPLAFISSIKNRAVYDLEKITKGEEQS